MAKEVCEKLKENLGGGVITEELPALTQVLQDYKYSAEENTPEELAKYYMEDGNFHFKCNKYRFAIASYTYVRKPKCTDMQTVDKQSSCSVLHQQRQRQPLQHRGSS